MAPFGRKRSLELVVIGVLFAASAVGGAAYTISADQASANIVWTSPYRYGLEEKSGGEYASKMKLSLNWQQGSPKACGSQFCSFRLVQGYLYVDMFSGNTSTFNSWGFSTDGCPLPTVHDGNYTIAYTLTPLHRWINNSNYCHYAGDWVITAAVCDSSYCRGNQIYLSNYPYLQNALNSPSGTLGTPWYGH